MWVIKYRKIFYGISGTLVVLSFLALFFWNIKFGVDFTGGSLVEFKYESGRPAKEVVEQGLKSTNIDLGTYSLREAGQDGYVLRAKNISSENKTVIENSLNTDDQKINITRFTNIGPSISSELKTKSLVAVAVVVLMIILYIAIAFSAVSKPVPSWKYGIISIATLVHDVMIPLGVFALLGKMFGVEVDTLFVISVLVVLGYSVSDTIVVFDRIRENLRHSSETKRHSEFSQIVGQSLKETFARSINTSVTTLIALIALFFFGGEVTKWFSLALIVGIIAGTYSSIFIASPLLVSWKLSQDKHTK